MKTTLEWKTGLEFTAQAEGNTLTMDAKSPLGHGHGMTPKELVAAGLGGCTAMDVVALLKKHKQSLESMKIEVEITPVEGTYPAVFKTADIFFHVTGKIEAAILLEAVHLSQTKYCSISAMLSKAFPIHYHVILNEEKIGQGQADFGG